MSETNDQASLRVRRMRATKSRDGWKQVNVLVPTKADADAIRSLAAGMRKIFRSHHPVVAIQNEPKRTTHVTLIDALLDGGRKLRMSDVRQPLNFFPVVTAPKETVPVVVVKTPIPIRQLEPVLRSPSKEQLMTRNGQGRMPISLKGFPPLLGKTE